MRLTGNWDRESTPEDCASPTPAKWRALGMGTLVKGAVCRALISEKANSRDEYQEEREGHGPPKSG